MSAFDRALKRVREESETLPDAMADAAAWLPPDGEDSSIPTGLLDRFTTEAVAPPQARAEREPRVERGPRAARERAPRIDEEPPVEPEPRIAPAHEQPVEPAWEEEGRAEPEPSELSGFQEEPQEWSPGAADAGNGAAVEPQERRVSTGLFAGFNPRVAGMLVSGSQMDHATAEQYGRLAAVLHHAQIERTIRKVMVTSAMAGEGKTLTALNLALTLSESYGRRVAFIDADLRCSRVHELLNVVRVTGLSEALEDDRRVQARMLEVSPRLSVLLAGCSNLDPKGALTSRRMAQILDEAAAAFDWVIVDTPPVVLLPDTNLLARMVDVAVVVVRAGRTAYDTVERAIHTLDKKRVLGVVLNDAQDAEALQYYYSDRTSR